MSARRNTTPENEWVLLRRLFICNKQQLAARLGITPNTLANWERKTAAGEPASENTRRAVAELLRTAMRAANGTEDYLIERRLKK